MREPEIMSITSKAFRKNRHYRTLRTQFFTTQLAIPSLAILRVLMESAILRERAFVLVLGLIDELGIPKFFRRRFIMAFVDQRLTIVF